MDDKFITKIHEKSILKKLKSIRNNLKNNELENLKIVDPTCGS